MKSGRRPSESALVLVDDRQRSDDARGSPGDFGRGQGNRVEMPGRAAYRPACSGGLAIGIAMASAATAAAVHVHNSSIRSCFLGFGLRDPKQGLFGILPELIGL